MNASYSTTLTASGGKPFLTANLSTYYNWSIANRGNLPANFTLNATTGILSGTANAVLTANFTVRVTDAANVFATKNCSLQITGPLDNGDADSDGVNNYREMYDGTNPFDKNSFEPLSIGLVAHYPFDGNAVDESGYKNDGDVKGAILTSDQYGNQASAYELNGTNNFIDIPNSLGNSEVGTISVWFNAKNWNQNTKGRYLFSITQSPALSITTESGPAGSGDWINLGIHPNSIGNTNLVFGVWADSGWQWADSAYSARTNQWQNVVGIFDKDRISIYINGTKKGAIPNDGYPVSATQEFIIGASAWSGTSFNGKIDEVRIYNRALTAAEVSQLYSEESGEPNMVLVQGGTLPQGSALANQTVSAFHIARFETTWAEWKQVRTWAVANGYTDLANIGQGSSDNHPVRNVSWYDTVKWLNAKSQMEGLMPVYSFNGKTYKTGQSTPTVLATANGYRLPAETEWEWAARGGVASQGYTYSGSNDFNSIAWYAGNSGNSTNAVGTKSPNELGLYDMSGNVFELCFELYTGSNQNRQLRGGGWNWDSTVLSVSHRVQWAGTDWRQNYFGFRYVRNAIGDMVTVQGGTLPQSSQLAGQKVQAFQIGRTEVTWGEWKTVRTWAAANGYSDLATIGNGTADNHPVRNVSWYDVVKWSNAKSQMEGLTPVYTINGTTYKTGAQNPEVNAIANGYRLPSEKEREWAARGGVLSKGYTYSGGNDLNTVAWYVSNSSGGTKGVGIKAANELGVYDMSGNVWEWCEDVIDTSRRRGLGGSWNDVAYICTVSFRGPSDIPGVRSDAVGLRLARNIGPKISISGTLPEATLNQAYAGYTFGAVGSTEDKVWSISEGTLPPGMSFSANGTLSGTPTTAGIYTFVVRVGAGGYWDEIEVEIKVPQPIGYDSDGDGVNDYRETYDGTDPANPQSFNPLSKGLLAHYPLTGNANDESGYFYNGMATGGPTLSQDRNLNRIGSYDFDGVDDKIEKTAASRQLTISGNFSFSVWFKTDKQETLPPESVSGIQTRKNYAVWPTYGDDSLGVGIGISVGTNGIVMYEHSAFYLPPILVYSANLGSGWNQAVVTCSSNKAPILYVNGKKVRTALSSGRKKAFYGLITGGGLAGGSYGNYKGFIDDLKAWNRALSDDEASQLYAAESSQTNMVTVQGGTLPAGSGLAGQTVANFQIGKYEVAWGEWKTIRTWAVANGYSDLANVGEGSADDHPVRNVSWYDVVKWCNAKSEKLGLAPVYYANGLVYRIGGFGTEGSSMITMDSGAVGYRLPFEAEWEWAARGGGQSQGYEYSGSNDVNEVGWYFGNSFGNPVPIAYGGGTWPVGSKKPNELGLYDMSGNMLELTWDTVSHGGSNSRHIARGGWWGYYPNPECKVFNRTSFHPPDSGGNLGFRLARKAGQ